MTFTCSQTPENQQFSGEPELLVSWDVALNRLGDKDPEALDHFYAFDQQGNTPFEIYAAACSTDADINSLFLDSLIASVQQCAGRDINDIEVEEDGFHLS